MLREIARQARKHVVRQYGTPPQGGCLEAAKFIARLVRKAGLKCRVVSGHFMLDKPGRLCQYPQHWWVRVGQNIVDVTADQFASEVNEPIAPICIGDAATMKRWQPGRCDLGRQ